MPARHWLRRAMQCCSGSPAGRTLDFRKVNFNINQGAIRWQVTQKNQREILLFGRSAVSRLVTAETPKRDILLSLYTGRAKKVFFFLKKIILGVEEEGKKIKEEKNKHERKRDVRRSKKKEAKERKEKIYADFKCGRLSNRWAKRDFFGCRWGRRRRTSACELE